jgi:hypothetical protein
VTDSETRIPAESLITFARTAFERLGLGSADAKMGAEILIDANLMGLDARYRAHRLANGTGGSQCLVAGAERIRTAGPFWPFPP